MRELTEIREDIEAVKKEKKEIAKLFGRRSVEYAELTEEIEELKDEYRFSQLHLET